MYGSFREEHTIRPSAPTLWSAGVLLAIQVVTSSLGSLVNFTEKDSAALPVG